MGRRHVEPELLHEAGQPWRLPFRQIEHEPRQRRGVNDRMLERALQSATDKPCVEGVVAVLDEHGAVRETQESAPCVLELRRADQHRAVDVVTLARVRVDGRAAVDQRVEEREGAFQGEPLRSDLEDEKRGVAGRLDIERDELRVVECGLRTDLGSVNGDLFPGHEFAGAPGLEIDLPGRRIHRASARARRAHAISSPLRARNRSTATP